MNMSVSDMDGLNFCSSASGGHADSKSAGYKGLYLPETSFLIQTHRDWRPRRGRRGERGCRGITERLMETR